MKTNATEALFYQNSLPNVENFEVLVSGISHEVCIDPSQHPLAALDRMPTYFIRNKATGKIEVYTNAQKMAENILASMESADSDFADDNLSGVGAH